MSTRQFRPCAHDSFKETCPMLHMIMLNKEAGARTAATYLKSLAVVGTGCRIPTAATGSLRLRMH